MRRALFPKPFPYMVLYRIESDTVSVYAVLHQARDPALWKRR
jgi:plasmid stabilization system protein ParE